ncbi:hypothetical protein MINT15_38640 [Saccharomonospora viridis]|uniref:Uncharacterized protein n=2 Tax=Saccharomonospora viridis TaxID=1852 RepID=C7MZK3_SACVD|nr:hypothetical protein Svir_32610 [Saccharomonospora viridis DSM 43017]KHF42347.1 hypothetical protein MINT15_38640 [Saccharomonospora viridis]
MSGWVGSVAVGGPWAIASSRSWERLLRRAHGVGPGRVEKLSGPGGSFRVLRKWLRGSSRYRTITETVGDDAHIVSFYRCAESGTYARSAEEFFHRFPRCSRKRGSVGGRGMN